ncbi:unnamed protein product [Rhizoctonia solani]|uniref:Uncharacterized protein n=1 Tax=Rhizoctonia solani TaxID=456999 RepID=A0A8H3BZ07_9AGAM|nr:unnamed protein product [Rhizoctonia solani]
MGEMRGQEGKEGKEERRVVEERSRGSRGTSPYVTCARSCQQQHRHEPWVVLLSTTTNGTAPPHARMKSGSSSDASMLIACSSTTVRCIIGRLLAQAWGANMIRANDANVGYSRSRAANSRLTNLLASPSD